MKETTIQYEARSVRGKVLAYYTDQERAIKQTEAIVQSGAKRKLFRVEITKVEEEISFG